MRSRFQCPGESPGPREPTNIENDLTIGHGVIVVNRELYTECMRICIRLEANGRSPYPPEIIVG